MKIKRFTEIYENLEIKVREGNLTVWDQDVENFYEDNDQIVLITNSYKVCIDKSVIKEIVEKIDL